MANLIGNPKREPRARWLLVAFYTLLVVGGLTMVYPFWLMITKSMSNSLDMRDRVLMPRYLVDRDELFLKFLTERYRDPQLLRAVYPMPGATRPVDYRGRLRAPIAPPEAALVNRWREWIRTADPAQLTVAAPDRVRPLYQAFLRRKFDGSIEQLNRAYHLMEESFDLVDLPERKPGPTTPAEPIFNDFDEFLRELPVSLLLSAGGEMAEACRAADAALFLEEESGLRWRFATANYRVVWDFLLRRGRALQNTLVLVTLAILAALTLNPLAAYALSRFPGRHGRMTLLVMILTIAFPAEVAMIPSFLLLRDFNILNTYAAIILPGVVSGFSIFLLKGFFDGLPEELFESATIDGASELEIFWNIAVPLSRPILAVIALGTFTATYGGYMWALLVCQDPQMWTLMVWLFQFQMNYANQPWLGMAAFVIASIPTLLVFVTCQGIILRGIVIPVEK